MPHPAAQLAPEVQSIYIYVKICQKRPTHMKRDLLKRTTALAMTHPAAQLAPEVHLHVSFTNMSKETHFVYKHVHKTLHISFANMSKETYMYEKKNLGPVHTALVMPHPEALLASEVKSIHEFVKRGLHIRKKTCER